MKATDFGSDEKFIELYDQLKSAQKVAEQYGCSKKTVLTHAKHIGYDVNKNKTYKLSEADKQYILDSYSTKTSTALAEELKVSRGMIT